MVNVFVYPSINKYTTQEGKLLDTLYDDGDDDNDLSVLSQTTLGHFMDCRTPSKAIFHSSL